MNNPKEQNIESPLAQAMKFGTLGGKPSPQEPEKENKPDILVTEQKPLVPPSSKSKRDKQSVYLSPDLLRWVKHRAVDQNKEISEVVEEALQYYRSHLED